MKISVVMTTYNGERYLEEQIDSILTQTLHPAELIVCDDQSTDGTVAILEKYQRQEKLVFVKNPQRLGLIKNFKKAVSLATAGNYVALSDQDDHWLPDKLEKSAALLQKMDENLPCLVYSDLILVDEQGKILNHSFKNEQGQGGYEENLETLCFRNFVTGCTILMNPTLRPFFAAIPDNVLFHDDWIALAAFTFGKVDALPMATVRYRKHSSNLSIATGTKPRNRYRSLLEQLLKVFKGRDDFMSHQFIVVRRFYNQYYLAMAPDKRLTFEKFLKMEFKSYFIKKLAFRRAVKRYQL